MEPILFFLAPHAVAQKQYEALRIYFVESVKVLLLDIGYRRNIKTFGNAL